MQKLSAGLACAGLLHKASRWVSAVLAAAVDKHACLQCNHACKLVAWMPLGFLTVSVTVRLFLFTGLGTRSALVPLASGWSTGDEGASSAWPALLPAAAAAVVAAAACAGPAHCEASEVSRWPEFAESQQRWPYTKLTLLLTPTLVKVPRSTDAPV